MLLYTYFMKNFTLKQKEVSNIHSSLFCINEGTYDQQPFIRQLQYHHRTSTHFFLFLNFYYLHLLIILRVLLENREPATTSDAQKLNCFWMGFTSALLNCFAVLFF